MRLFFAKKSRRSGIVSDLQKLLQYLFKFMAFKRDFDKKMFERYKEAKVELLTNRFTINFEHEMRIQT